MSRATPNTNSPFYRLKKTLPFIDAPRNFYIPDDVGLAQSLTNFGFDNRGVRCCAQNQQLGSNRVGCWHEFGAAQAQSRVGRRDATSPESRPAPCATQ